MSESNKKTHMIWEYVGHIYKYMYIYIYQSNHDVLKESGWPQKEQHPNKEELSGKNETPLVAPPTEQQSCCQAFRWTVLPFARHSWSPWIHNEGSCNQ